MNKLISFFIKNPIWANALIVVTAAFGVLSLASMDQVFFPELDPNEITIKVSYPGASPEEIEEGITIKIEEAIKNLKDIDEYKSVSSENKAEIKIKAFQDTDMDELLTDVTNGVNGITNFPEGAEKPIVIKEKVSEMGSTVAYVAVLGDLDLFTLKAISEHIEDDFINSKLISKIELFGYPPLEFSVEVSEQQLKKYQIRFDEIVAAIQNNNRDFTGGTVKTNSEELIIRSRAKTTDPFKLEDIVVRTSPEGELVRISDLGKVKFQFSDVPFSAYTNWKRAVNIQVIRQPDEDLGDATNYILNYVAQFNKTNSDVQLKITYMAYTRLEDRIQLLVENGIVGLLLVVLTLGLFLSIRLSAWVAFGIPFSFLGMYIIGSFYGLTINMISLFGMIIVVGILVDDGIVIAENIYSHFERGKSSRQAAIDGTIEVLPSVITSILTTIVAFSVLLFIEGMEMMRHMAFVVMAALGFSMVEAFLVLPSHLSSKTVLSEDEVKSNIGFKILFYLGAFLTAVSTTVMLNNELSIYFGKFGLEGVVLYYFITVGAIATTIGFVQSGLEQKVRPKIDNFISYVKHEIYGYLLKKIIPNYKKLAFLPLVFILFVFLGLAKNGFIPFTFFPVIDPDNFNIEVAYKTGEREEQTKAFLDRCAKAVEEVSQEIIDQTGDTIITDWNMEVGRAKYLAENGGHAGLIRVNVDTEGKALSANTIMRMVQDKIGQVKGVEKFKVSGNNGFWGKPVEISVMGKEFDQINEATAYLKDELKKNYPDLKDITDNAGAGNREVNIELKPKAYLLGLNQGEIARQIRQGYFGAEAQRLIVGTDEVRVYVRYPKSDRSTIEQLDRMTIKTVKGQEIPLSELVTYSIKRGRVSIKHFDGKRENVVEAELKNPEQSVAEILADIKKNVVPVMASKYSGIEVEFRGQSRRAEKAISSMMIKAIIVIGTMLLILTLNFRSVYQSIIVLSLMPVAVASAMFGHAIQNMQMSILSIFGIIALLGIVVNDAVVFLDTYNRNLKEGMAMKEAIYDAAISRFRPIILTSITTVAGLFPLILETSFQAQFLIPMAVSVSYGVLLGTIFILLFLPVKILFFNDMRRYRKAFVKSLRDYFLKQQHWQFKLSDRLNVEPALKTEEEEE